MPLIDTRELDVREPKPGWRGRFVHSDAMTLSYYEVDAGAVVPEHSHENDEVWNVIEGELEIVIEGERHVAGPGCAAVVPPHSKHSVRALRASRAIVVDHPRRDAIGGVDIR